MQASGSARVDAEREASVRLRTKRAGRLRVRLLAEGPDAAGSQERVEVRLERG